MLGLSIAWLWSAKPWRVALGSGILAGVLLQDALRGLLGDAAPAERPYWVAIVALAVGFAAVVSATRVRSTGAVLLQAGTLAGTAAAVMLALGALNGLYVI